MKIYHFVLGPLKSNCYVIEAKDQCVLIDPGDEADFILNFILSNRLELVGILETHGHFDHIGAAGEIQLSFDVPLYINKKDEFLIERLKETAEYFLGYDPHYLKPKNIKFFDENTDKFRVGNFEFEIIWTPGHTPGSSIFIIKDQKYAFIGDTIFEDGIGRTDFSYSSPTNMRKSIQKILELPDDTLLYPGHGDCFYVSDKK